MKKYTVELIEDGEDLVLPLPEEIMTELGWKIDDILKWKIQENTQQVILSKKDTDE